MSGPVKLNCQAAGQDKGFRHGLAELVKGLAEVVLGGDEEHVGPEQFHERFTAEGDAGLVKCLDGQEAEQSLYFVGAEGDGTAVEGYLGWA